MKVGETKDISLNATGSQQDYLWLCYTTDEQTTMKNISLNTSCVQCLGEHSGPCDPLPNRPNWTVTRSQQGSCFERTKLTLTVRAANVSEEDRGKFMLTWSSDEEKQGPKKHKVLTVVTLNITADSRPRGSVENKTNYMYIYIAIGGSSVALLVIVTGIVMVAWSVWRRSNTPASADTPNNTPVASEDTPRSRRRRRRMCTTKIHSPIIALYLCHKTSALYIACKTIIFQAFRHPLFHMCTHTHTHTHTHTT